MEFSWSLSAFNRRQLLFRESALICVTAAGCGNQQGRLLKRTYQKFHPKFAGKKPFIGQSSDSIYRKTQFLSHVFDFLSSLLQLSFFCCIWVNFHLFSALKSELKQHFTWLKSFKQTKMNGYLILLFDNPCF